ncbi:putative Ca2+/H+ antiporter (TMEM165/GDT1 family) [Kushneria sinocarnis]|uniref:GDT1 family protein n=1 Tax=Kushneria sinocarnis TaxID=595502 RepID=A0A420WTW1_9GAMM|nr:TMEM165/GDT1 family protein [Kushneria sinocarnis]RKQ96895.1 putative Ca2+/H+ antiporter (TMEM165/GDT1 family) [Kushneria sinocarnis]
MVQALLVSFGSVAIAELGDKTQLLALLLAIRFRRPWPIFWGILGSSVLNHAVSAWLGGALSTLIDRHTLDIVTGFAFIAIGLWMLKPDEDPELSEERLRLGVFGSAFVLFTFAELGDKTQFATILLGARFHDFPMVTLGSTLGMMVANTPVLWLGARFASRLPTRPIHVAATLLFMMLGGWTLLGAAGVT